MPQHAATYQEFAQRVLAAVDIVEIVGGYVELRRAGANLKGLCPFHREKTPSFNVHPDKQIFKCFGCGKGGDAISFVREIERVDFRQALEILARRCNMEVPAFRATDDASDRRLRWRQTLGEALAKAAEHCRLRLLHPEHGRQARAYLEGRGVSPETAEHFGIGVVGEDWQGLCDALKRQGYSEQALIDSGIAKERRSGQGVYDYLRGRLVFPIVNSRGETIGFGGRAFGDEPPKYLNTPETDLFHKGRELYGLHQGREALTRDKRPAVLVEGYMDVVGAHQAGVAGAVASMGTALTSEQAALLRRFTAEAVFLYDADEAGTKAILRGLEVLLGAGLTVRVGLMPPGEDPDSLARKHGPEALQRVVAEAPHFFDFLVGYARNAYDFDLPEQRLAAVDLFAAPLRAIEERLVRDGYVARLAAELDQDEAALRRYLEKLERRTPRRRERAVAPPPGDAPPRPAEDDAPPLNDDGATPYGDPAEEALIGSAAPTPREMGMLHILVEHGDARHVLDGRFNPEWIEHPRVRHWARTIIALPRDVSDVWEALRATHPSAQSDAFLQQALFSAEEPHDEGYVAIAELLAGYIERDHLRRENRRVDRRIHEASHQRKGVLPENLAELIARKTEIQRRIAEIEEAARRSDAMPVRY